MNSPGPREKLDLLAVSTTCTDGIITVAVCGEVNSGNHEQLRTRLAAVDLSQARTTIYLELRELYFCDSGGYRILVGFVKRAMAAGHEVGLHCTQAGLLEVLAPVGERDVNV